MKYPKFLKEGNRIGFIAPSFGCTTEPYESGFKRALEKFKLLGFKTVLGPNCFECSGFGKSNTPEKCGEEINDFFTQDNCDVIISCGGGETMCEDLTFVDFEEIKRSNPKWFMGYSDNTNLAFLLPTLCDIASIYGPNAPTFGQEKWHDSLEDALNVLTGKNLDLHNYDKWEKYSFDYLTNDYNVTEEFKLVSKNLKEEFSGRVIGGCLDVLKTICGTKFDKVKEFCDKYKEDKIIFFFEVCELSPVEVRRTLWQLDNAGWFNNCSGFLVGRPCNYDYTFFELDHKNAVLSILEEKNLPIIMDLDIGHLPPMMPIIEGAYSTVKIENGNIEIKQELI